MRILRSGFLSLAASTALFAFGCGPTPTEMDGDSEEQSASASRERSPDAGTAQGGPSDGGKGTGACVCVPFQNPVVAADLPVLPGGAPDLQTVPEGLMLVDDQGKPTSELHTDWDTVVFAHGWSREGKAEEFPSPKIWRDRSFNTLIYRWHRRSFEPGVIPIEASKRIPSVATELAGLLESLKRTLGAGASKEIRLVGHSLGGLVMTYAADKLAEDASRSQRRLELLDPAYLFDFTDPGAQATPRSDGVSYSEAGLKLSALSQAGVHVVSYNSVVAKLWGQKDTWTAVNVQELSPQWQKGDFIKQHSAVVPYYFESLAKPPPTIEGSGDPGFSASLPTGAITKSPRRLEQTTGIDTTDIGDDAYKRM
jgi:pimeloyl-ACP methyl ester carboxylesterase